MIAPSIKSRPVYGTLRPQPGSCHLIVADADGAAAIVDLAARAPQGFFGCAHILHLPGGDEGAALRALAPARREALPTVDALLARLTELLATARMGSRLYLAGTEGLIGQAMRVAIGAGIDPPAIETEHRGSLRRRVQCVHCKGITEDVTTQPVACARCGLHLFVRDHYSRRMAAFQGVCIDAEEPGAVPTPEEIYP